jgi:hypothetical protein
VKLQIINLDAEDDHVSTRDKLSWAKADRAVLVWPRRGTPLAEQIDLALVQRHARRRGIELGLISYHPSVRAHAARLGIPVFESIDALPAESWTDDSSNGQPSSRRSAEELAELRAARDSSRPTGLARLGEREQKAVLGTVAVALFVVGFVALPAAEVTLQPNTSVLRDDVELLVDPGLLNGPISNRIPGQWITKQVGADMQADPTGSIRQPSTVAVGEVVFNNLTDEPVIIPAGTGLRAGEIRFLTEQPVRLQPGASPTDPIPVKAAVPGLSGNVDAEAIDAVEGSIGFLVQVSNPSPTLGGRDIRAAAVSQLDQLELREALIDQMFAQVEQELLAELGGDQILVPGSLRVGRVLEERYDRSVGEAAPSLALTLRAEIQGIVFSRLEAEQATEALLAGSLPASRFIIPASVSIEADDSIPVGELMRVELQVRAQVAEKIDFDNVRQIARALPKTQAGLQLKRSLDLPEPPEIAINPAWFPWLPFMEMRISVRWMWESSE